MWVQQSGVARGITAGERVSIGLGEQRSLLGTLPEATFVRRYRQSFGSA